MSIKNSQKGSIEISTIAAMAIIAAMVAAVSIYATIKYYETPTNTPPIAVITPKLTLSATPTPIPVVNQETVGWKIYNWNNLEFKYPPTWTVEKSYYRSAAQQAQGIAPENVGVSIYPDIFKRGNIYINIGGSQVNCNPSQNHTKCSYISSIANYIYTDSDDIGIRNTFDQILSTLKFTGNNETADWQTYKNDKYGFEIKYPLAFIEIPYLERPIDDNEIILRSFNEAKPNDYYGTGEVEITINQGEINLKNIIGPYNKIKKENVKNIVVSGRQSYIYTDWSTGGCNVSVVLIPNSNKTFKIYFRDCTYPPNANYNMARLYMDQMLSTFKFTE